MDILLDQNMEPMLNMIDLHIHPVHNKLNEHATKLTLPLFLF